jgi:hypothetical protein
MVAATRDKMGEERPVNICLDVAEVLLDSENIHDKDVIVGYCRALLGESEEAKQMAACLTNIALAEQLLQFQDMNDNIFLKLLFERKELHQAISNTGWGAAAV